MRNLPAFVALMLLCEGLPAYSQEPARDARAKAIDALRAFEKVDKPEESKKFSQDEHVARSIGRQFVASLETALIARVWTREEAALTEVERRLQGFFKDPEQKEQRHRFASQGFSFYTLPPEQRSEDPGLADLLRCLDRLRPELAARLREEILRGARTAPPQPRYGMSRDLSQRERDRDGMRTKPAETEPLLLAILKDDKASVSRQCDAAYGLASAGNAQGLAWLERACVQNLGLGASPALHLMESGDRGEALFLQLLTKEDGPGMSYALSECLKECREDLLWKHLDQFVLLKNDSARYSALSAIQGHPIPEQTFLKLIDRIDRMPAPDEPLVSSVIWSLGHKGCASDSMRATARLWVDRLLTRDGPRYWKAAAQSFLKTHLGSPEVLATVAREQLRRPIDSPLVFDVLAEVGAAKDAAAIWEAIRELKEDYGYLHRARAWLAICRLTAPLAD